MFSPVQLEIIRKMQDGHWVSGSQLAAELNISRTAVWKHMHALETHTLVLQKHTKKGYRLTEPLFLLDETQIKSGLNSAFMAENPEFHFLQSTESTNLFCRKITSASKWLICCSEEQTAGKGRMGRQWVSPFAQNIYCTLKWLYHDSLEKLSGLSLAVSIALHRALSPYVEAEHLKIKWPNDLLYSGKKLSGILIEITSEPHNASQIIIGFGININTNTDLQALSEHPHCSLRDVTAKCYNRNPIISACLNHLHQVLTGFNEEGLKPFMAEWDAHDALYNQTVAIHQHHQTYYGIAKGISLSGHLQLQTSEGIVDITIGDASIQKNQN